MMKILQITACGAAALMLFAGCYSYQRPVSATLGDTYSERKRDAADDMLKDIKVLTLLDAQRIAIKNNPTYIAAYHAVEAARMRYYQAWGAYSPTITASFGLGNAHRWRYNDPAESTEEVKVVNNNRSFTTSLGAQANMLLFDGFARYFRLKASNSELKYYKHMEEDACRTMMLSVSYAYNTVLLAIEQRRIAMEDRKFQLESLQNTQYKFEAGAAPLSDVLNFEILVNNAEVNMLAADYSYDTAIYSLAVLMGYPDGTLPVDLQFSGDFKSYFAEIPAVEIYLDAALANRPDLKAYREQLNVSKYQVYQAWGAYSPVVNGFVSLDFGTDSTRNGGFVEADKEYTENLSLSYGLTVDWTIFNGAIRYNKLREAQAAMAVADYQVAAQWFKVVEEVRSAYANYIQNVKKTQLFAKVRDLSAKQRDLVDDEYRAGQAELTRLNEAQRDLVQAETNLASSFINIQNAKAQLESVVGGNTADYYLSDSGKSNNDRYPGLGNFTEEDDPAEAEAESGKAAPVTKAPEAKAAVPAAKAAAETPAKQAAPTAKAPAKEAKTPANAPAIPASATAAPAGKK